MQIEMRKEGKVLIIKLLEKRLDANIAMDFKREMEKRINDGNTWIVLDLAQAEFMDSSFLFIIVSSLRLLWRNGKIVIAGAGESVKNLLRLTKMDRVFQMFNDADGAVTDLAN